MITRTLTPLGGIGPPRDERDAPQVGRSSMTSELRGQLRDRLSSIRHQGGPAAGISESFGIPCVMDTDQLRALQSLIGERNEGPFCGAEPGCLTLLGRVRHG